MFGLFHHQLPSSWTDGADVQRKDVELPVQLLDSVLRFSTSIQHLGSVPEFNLSKQAAMLFVSQIGWSVFLQCAALISTLPVPTPSSHNGANDTSPWSAMGRLWSDSISSQTDLNGNYPPFLVSALTQFSIPFSASLHFHSKRLYKINQMHRVAFIAC